MPSKQQLMLDMIPYEDQLYVDRLRKFIGDTVELNVLDEKQECTDIEIYHFIQDALDEINFEYLPTTSWKKISDVPSWNILKIGAVLQLLTSKGIHSSRNTITYNDGGGVTIQDMDKYGRYINYYNILITKYARGVQSMKIGNNVDDAYGGVSSEYGFANNGSTNNSNDIIW